MDRREGVTLHSPPTSIKFRLLSNKNGKRKASSSDSRCPPPSSSTRSFSPGPSSDCLPASSKPEIVIGDYIEFIGIKHNKDTIIQTLIENDLTSYKLFGSAHLTKDDLLRLNLPIGVVTSLRENVNRYSKYLSLNAAQTHNI